MDLNGILLIAAIIISPLLAVSILRWTDRIKTTGELREEIFSTLMATRSERDSSKHIRALNMIDCAFSGRRILWFRHTGRADKKVLAAWKDYQDQISTKKEDAASWQTRTDELFIDLLDGIASASGYRLDKSHVRRGLSSRSNRSPLSVDQLLTRENLAKLLGPEKTLPVDAVRILRKIVK